MTPAAASMEVSSAHVIHHSSMRDYTELVRISFWPTVRSRLLSSSVRLSLRPSVCLSVPPNNYKSLASVRMANRTVYISITLVNPPAPGIDWHMMTIDCLINCHFRMCKFSMQMKIQSKLIQILMPIKFKLLIE